uniref:7TM_GPCR_Srx domain-containing protein n=1 Tax=Strongyloides venezuelensis TaxID=75913 RepID=A0A0K0F4C5_STRVS
MDVTSSIIIIDDTNIYLSSNELTINKYICSVFFLVSSVSILFDGLILYVFFRKRKLLVNVAYKIQLSISVVIFIQQIIFWVTSIFGFTSNLLPNVLDTILGAIVQGIFLTLVSFIFLLTFNAFDIFYKQKVLPNINRNKFFTYGLYLCYAWGVFMTIFYMFPDFSFTYSLVSLGFEYSEDFEKAFVAFEIENKFVIVFLTISFVIYIFIIIKVIRMRKMSNKSTNATFRWSDVKFIVQGLSNFVCYLFIELLWEYDTMLTDSRYSSIIINFFFLCNSSINILLTILMISEIRREIIYLLSSKKKNKITIVLSHNNFKNNNF